MLRTHNRLLHRGLQTSDLFIVGGAVWLGATLWGGEEVPTASILRQAAVLCVAWLVVSLRTGFYRSKRTGALGREVLELLENWVVTLASGSLLVFAVWGSLVFDPLATFGMALLGTGALRLIVRLALRRLRDHGWNFRRVVLVGKGRATHKIAQMIASKPYYGIRIVGLLALPGEDGTVPDGVDYLGEISQFSDAVAAREVDSVLLCPDMKSGPEHVHDVLDRCDVAGIECFYVPDILSLENLRVSSTSFGGIPAFKFGPRLGTPTQMAIKRGMDVAGSLLGIAVCLPVLVAVAVAVKLCDGGPLFFRQIRLGKDGRRFYCYKFRSMRVDAEREKVSLEGLNEQDGPAFKVKNDPRTTAVGRFIRKYSLDELPQLFNVLMGDMSLVGPRPPVPAEVAQYDWWQRRRISVRPGLTCLWQVRGRNRVSFDTWMEMDLFYIDNWSLWLDIKLMMQTMPAVVRGSGS